MLSGCRILDLTDERGHLAGKILADLGAEVTKVEAPGGDPLRRRGPFLGGVEGPERSLPWLALNTGKQSVTLDLETTEGCTRFRELAAASDAVIESAHPGTYDRLGIGYESLRGELQHLVWCAITPFGQTGPWAGYEGHDLVVVAMGGNAAMTGEPDGPPLRCTMPTAYYHAAPEAACAVVIALHARERTGAGTFVDVSMQECQVGTLLSGPGRYALSGHLERRAGARMGRTREIWSCKDGYVTFGLRGGPARLRNLIATAELMAEHGMCPAWMRDYDWSRYNHNTLSDEEIARFEEAFGAFFATRTMRELYEEALQRRILLAPCNDAREITSHPQLRDRGLFVRLEYSERDGAIEHPSFFAKSDRPGIGLRSAAPRLGAAGAKPERAAGSSARVGAEMERAGASAEPFGAEARQARAASARAGTDQAASLARRRPGEPREPGDDGDEADTGAIFAGLKVLELGSGVAGPLATRYFTDRGARVIRVESTERPDFLRSLHLTGDDPRELDRAPMFVLLNPGKQSVTLNLATDEGVALAKRLAAWADVVSENFAPGVMAKWGLDAESLRRERPELIYVSSCLFGQTGPQRNYPGFGGQGAAIAGFNHLTGRAGGPAHGPYATITDSLSPRYVGLLIAAALLERKRTGEGRTLDVSQIETGVYSLSEMLVRYSASGEVISRNGNHDEHAAPHDIYPCRGADRWIAIAVLDDLQWIGLTRAMGEPDWARQESLAHLPGRLARQDEIDVHIAEWTAARDAYELMDSLQRAGVEAGVVQSFADLQRDPQLAHREHFVRLEHAHLGELSFERMGFRLADHPEHLHSPGPNIGEHNEEVLSGLLGLSAGEIDRLLDRGVLR